MIMHLAARYDMACVVEGVDGFYYNWVGWLVVILLT